MSDIDNPFVSIILLVFYFVKYISEMIESATMLRNKYEVHLRNRAI